YIKVIAPLSFAINPGIQQGSGTRFSYTILVLGNHSQNKALHTPRSISRAGCKSPGMFAAAACGFDSGGWYEHAEHMHVSKIHTDKWESSTFCTLLMLDHEN